MALHACYHRPNVTERIDNEDRQRRTACHADEVWCTTWHSESVDEFASARSSRGFAADLAGSSRMRCAFHRVIWSSIRHAPVPDSYPLPVRRWLRAPGPAAERPHSLSVTDDWHRLMARQCVMLCGHTLRAMTCRACHRPIHPAQVRCHLFPVLSTVKSWVGRRARAL